MYDTIQTISLKIGWTAILVCGPTSMITDVRNCVQQLQTENDAKIHLHEETFEI
jgi:hypothetical protein